MNNRENRDLVKLVAATRHYLGNGIQVHKLDEFLDRLFQSVQRVRKVHCRLDNNSVVQLGIDGGAVRAVHVPRAKAKLRTLCARLAIRCADISGQQISPYGDAVRFVRPGTDAIGNVSFVNTNDSVSITIVSHAAAPIVLRTLPKEKQVQAKQVKLRQRKYAG